MLERRPASCVVVEVVRKKFRRRVDKDALETDVLVADPLSLPIDKGLAGPGMLAETIVRHWCDHQPAHRQEAIYARDGLELARSTICGWLQALALSALPLIQAMKATALIDRVVHHADHPDLPHAARARSAARPSASLRGNTIEPWGLLARPFTCSPTGPKTAPSSLHPLTGNRLSRTAKLSGTSTKILSAERCLPSSAEPSGNRPARSHSTPLYTGASGRGSPDGNGDFAPTQWSRTQATFYGGAGCSHL